MIFIFIIGLCVGSFINSFVFRLKTGESILWPRSHCPRCKKILKWYDLIPILSFLILRGKCRYCGAKISIQYPLVEITTASLFLTIFNYQFSIFNQFSISNFSPYGRPPAGWQFFDALALVYLLFITSVLIIIFLSDLKYYIIPDRVIYPAIAISFIPILIYKFYPNLQIFGNSNLFYALLAAILPALFFFSLVALSRGKWMGVGDIKLVFFMGLVLGWPNILAALFLSFISGAVAGLILIAAKKKTMKSEIPFGVFLSSATLVALLWGDKMIEWYWGLLL